MNKYTAITQPSKKLHVASTNRKHTAKHEWATPWSTT